MTPVAGEQFVASDARQRDLVPAGNRLGEKPRRDRRVVGVGFVEGVNDRLEDVPDLRTDVDDREVRTMTRGQRPGQIRFIGRGRSGAPVARGERVGSVPRERHARHDRGGVEATAQERGHRHVAHEVCGHRLVEPLPHTRLGVGRTGTVVRRELPIPACRDVAIPPPYERVSGLHLAHAHERGRRGRDVPELEVGIERLPVEVARGQPGGVQRLELGGERDPPRGGDDVQGFDPETVTGEAECLRGRVPDGEGEHPAEGGHAVGAPFFVQVHHRLRVAS